VPQLHLAVTQIEFHVLAIEDAIRFSPGGYIAIAASLPKRFLDLIPGRDRCWLMQT